MNKNSQMYFTTGEFARMRDISKHTLFYYDKLGIFSPEIKGENGYRYYSVSQIDVFHVIAALKELDMPLAEIKAYLDRRSPKELVSLLWQQERLLEKKINALKGMKALIHKKMELAKSAQRVDINSLCVRAMREQYLVTTDMPAQTSERDWALRVAEHLRFCYDNDIISPYAIGATIELPQVLSGDYSQYSRVYTQAVVRPKNIPVLVKPAGDYLVAYHKGGYETTGEAYARIMEKLTRAALTPEGSFFEDVLLDELSNKGYENHVLQISVKVK